MDFFTSPVSEHMLSPVRTVAETDSVASVEQELSKLGISALPVVDRAGAMAGVISRTDLLEAGRVRVLVNGRRRKTLTLPEASARELMSTTVEFVSPDTRLSEAARRLLKQHVHRLYVSEGRYPLGVIGSREIMWAVFEAKLGTPISEAMHGSLVVVSAGDPLSLAIDRMSVSHHSGLVVVEDGWPVGLLTQADALAARDAPPNDRVDEWMDPRVICLPLAMPLYRAAQQAVATRARRVLAVDGKGVRGILSALDFARVVKG